MIHSDERKRSMKPNLLKSMAGGLAGTVMMTMMMRFVAPMMLGHPMDIAGMLANMMGVSWAIGMVAHVMNGVVIFPLAYALVAFRFLPGPPVLRGVLWGVVLWLVAEMMVMPMAGAGFFSSEIGGAKAVFAALMGHLVYGALLGFISGTAVLDAPERATSRA
jgi:uncharacterized membrane protein YagU involved in acid resistance